MAMSRLPSPRAFVTQLLNSLPSLQQRDASAEPSSLSDAPEIVKKQLLLLQVLFPNEFLPALDLLDRNLVTCFIIGIEKPPAPSTNRTTSTTDIPIQGSDELLSTCPGPAIQEKPSTSFLPVPRPPSSSDTIYYVRSAQQRSSRFSTSYDSIMTYEVRLGAWNCTCPAFSFAAFPAVHPEPHLPTFIPKPTSSVNQDMQDENVEEEKRKVAEWMFGGVSLGQEMPPVCKHLLACVLAERCRGVFGECVEEREVGIETAAGWAAGWGDT
ncbi:uncharacterized protein M421DRAFT_208487 [Didymella exigua CBS 183.55]|uniref:SWIM-type domain-containing protein n=1 Tax=Didymella exigua CBS 183.55 TaxID=1150837 RepID=A0A6A5RIF5_9PLEO|nr:uncharacterized protein M421DRAFT_208487 [Didymella exigua CBS 183.55]KAF1926868.1 hypothetical protein M421DRAFT_208487 [Didymella exigua CBS 183.55]